MYLMLARHLQFVSIESNWILTTTILPLLELLCYIKDINRCSMSSLRMLSCELMVCWLTWGREGWFRSSNVVLVCLTTTNSQSARSLVWTPTSKEPRHRARRPMTPASSMTSRIAAELESSLGSRPPPGTIHRSLSPLDVTSSIYCTSWRMLSGTRS